MSAGVLSSVTGLNDVLRHCRNRVHLHTVIRGSARVVVTLLGGLLIACLLDYALALPSWCRALLLLVVVCSTGLTVWRSLLRPLLTPVSRQELGAAVDLAFPDLHEAVATLLSVESPDATSSEAGSAAMRSRIRQQVAAGLTHVRVGQVTDQRSTLMFCGLGLSLASMMILPILLWPSGSGLLLQRLAVPWANLASVTNLWFEIPNSGRYAARDSDVLLIAIPRWRTRQSGTIPTDVTLQLQTDDGRSDHLPMGYNDVASRFEVTLPRVQNSLNYRVSGGGSQTQWYRLNVDVRPSIVSALMTATPPAYSGRPVDVIDGIVGRVEVFEHSELEITLKFNKPVSRTELVWQEWSPITSETAEDELEEETAIREAGSDQNQVLLPEVVAGDRLSAVFRMAALGSGRFQFQIEDDVQLTNALEPERRLVVIEDQPPELAVSGLQDELEMRPNDIVPLDCQVADDIGVGLLELHIQKNDEPLRIEPARDLDRGSRHIDHSFRLSLADLDLKEGESLSLRVRTADECPNPEPHVVWKGPWTIRISNAASPIGKAALNAADQQMIDQLRQIEQELQKDAERGNQLKNDLWKQWNAETQDGVRQLSEKEQLQGRTLQQIADQVAQHPLMEQQASDLNKLGQSVREDVANQLQDAAGAERNAAAGKLQDSVKTLQRMRDQLHRTIQEIEQLAELEQELAELNRLALEAEQLAERADQLRQQQNPPTGQSQEEFQQQQQAQQQQLEGDRRQLSGELDDLLRRREELLESARRAQLDKLAALSESAKNLAGQEQLISEGIKDESRDAVQKARPLAERLREARDDARALARDMEQQQPELTRPEIGGLDSALKALREGNFADARQNLDTGEQELRTATDTLTNAAQKDLGAQADQLADTIADVRREIEELMPDQAAATKPVEDGNPPQSVPAVAEQLLERLQQLSEASDAAARAMKDNAAVNRESVTQAEQAAQQADASVQTAGAGRFAEAADKMRRSASAGQRSADRLDDDQQDRRQELTGIAKEISRLADLFDQLQQDDAAQAGAQRKTQQRIAEQAGLLPQQLEELSQRLNLESLGLPQQGRQAEEARQAAAAAAQTGQQASSELQQAELKRASESAAETAAQLNRAAQLASQGSQADRSKQPVVPAEVGDSVTQALHSLEKAGQMARDALSQQEAQQSEAAGATEQTNGQTSPSTSPENGATPSDAGNSPETPATESDTQGASSDQASSQPPGSSSDQSQSQSGGQPSAPSDASQQLSQAAKALADAARGALPQQFTPGQLSDSENSKGQAQQGTGNDQGFDGLSPQAAQQGAARLRRWGLLQDSLDGELSDAGKDVVDHEYSDLIRRYRRELARAAAGQSTPPATDNAEPVGKGRAP